MDFLEHVDVRLPHYRGRLMFYGGRSTQRTLPRGSVHEVRAESEHLLDPGTASSYVFASSNVATGAIKPPATNGSGR